MSRHLKKIMKDYQDIITEPITNVKVTCNESNLYNLYCIIYGLDDEYSGGEYIFNIKLSANHPMEPPDFYFLTPNGRFEINKKLCFSNSSYHLESWSPMWNLRTIILGFLSFFLEKESKGVGHISSTKDIKISYAIKSKEYNLSKLAEIHNLFYTLKI
jgi:ubiquitin-protein ligase